MAVYVAMGACALVFTVIGALAIREIRKPAEVATCMHGVPSPCGICGEFEEGYAVMAAALTELAMG